MTSTAQVSPPKLHQPEARRAKPVKWWALGGGLVLSLTAFSWARWLLGGYAHPTPTGPTPVPDWMLVVLRAHEVVFGSMALVVIYRVLIKPWRIQRRLTFDGMLLIGFMTIWMFQDPIVNYTQVFFTYNSHSLNLGCPQCFLPGWQSHAQSFPEPLWAAVFYPGGLVLATMGFCRVMQAAKRRWPRLGIAGLVGFIWGFAILIDLIFEIFWVRTGVYVLPGAHPEVSAFSDTYYKLPLYEPVFGGLWFALLACCRYFRNDRGESVAERGITEVRGTARQRTSLRLLAVIGMANAAAFIGYSVPTYLIALHAGPWPSAVIDRSYLTGNTCGPGTTYACPEARIPIWNGPDNVRVTPEGEIIAPKGIPEQLPRPDK